MANKSIKISIATALNAVGITAAKRALSSLASHTKDFAKAVGSNLMNIKAGFDLVAAGARKFLDVMSKGMEFERMTTTFKTLTGSMELAKAHMKDLQDLGRTPPFSLEEFAAASQAMMKMTGGMAGFKSEMEIVGDMAAATGNDIATVGRAFGLAYQVIRDGQDFGRAGQQLYSLGIMTKKQVAEFAELSKAGTDNAAVWSQLQEVFGRYKGAMSATEQTAKGLVEAIQGEATVAVTTFSQAVTETAKPALEGLLGLLKRINEDGTIDIWADKVVSAMTQIGRATENVVGWIGKVIDGYRSVVNFGERVGSFFGAVAGTLYGGGNLSEANEAGIKSLAQTRREQAAEAEDRARAEEDIMKRVEERRLKRAEDAAKAEADAKKRIAEDMSKAQFETDWKNDVERWKSEHDEFKKAQEKKKAEAEKAAKERAEMERKAAKKLADEQSELERKRHDNKMKQLDAEAAKTQEMIDRLLARGADDPMARAGGGGWQGDELRADRQAKINDDRIAKEQGRLADKARDKFGDFWEAAINDPDEVKKLGRLSNIQKAALEKMQLDKAKKAAELLEQKKQKAIEDMDQNLKDIAQKLKDVGL